MAEVPASTPTTFGNGSPLNDRYKNSAVARLLVEGRLPDGYHQDIGSPALSASSITEAKALRESPSGSITIQDDQSPEFALDLSARGHSARGTENTPSQSPGGDNAGRVNRRKRKNPTPHPDYAKPAFKCMYCPFEARNAQMLYSHFQYHQQILAGPTPASSTHMEWIKAYQRLPPEEEHAPPRPLSGHAVSRESPRPMTNSPALSKQSSPTLRNLLQSHETDPNQNSASGFLKSIVQNILQNGKSPDSVKSGKEDIVPNPKYSRSSLYDITVDTKSGAKMYGGKEAEGASLLLNDVAVSKYGPNAWSGDPSSALTVQALSGRSPEGSDESLFSLYKRSLNFSGIKQEPRDMTDFGPYVTFPLAYQSTGHAPNPPNTTNSVVSDPAGYNFSDNVIGTETFQRQSSDEVNEINSESPVPVSCLTPDRSNDNGNAQTESALNQGNASVQNSYISPIIVEPQLNMNDSANTGSFPSVTDGATTNDVPRSMTSPDSSSCSTGVQCELISPSHPSGYDVRASSPDRVLDRAEEYPNRCQHCGISFCDEVIFSIHMGCHSHKDPFICNVCGKACGNKYVFYTHIMRGHEHSNP